MIACERGTDIPGFFFLLQTLPVLAEVAGLGIAPFGIKVRHACSQEDRCTRVPPCILACASLQFLLCAESNPFLAFAAALLSSFAGFAMSEELRAAKAELQRKKKNLLTAIQRHDELLESSSPESQEVLKAELGVAKAKLGVAEAKLGVAEAEDETPGRQSEIAKAEMGVAKAEMGVAKAEWDIAIAAYTSEAKTSNPERLEILQGQINDRKETYKRLEGQLSSLDFHAPPG